MSLKAGSSAVCISPSSTQFLDGYPLVRRFSTGVDTDLYSSALYVENGAQRWLAMSLDLLFLDKDSVQAIRAGIEAQTSLAAGSIMVAVTHTHSAPVSRGPYPFYVNDPQRHPDSQYLEWVVEQAILSGVEAFNRAQAAEIGFALADSSAIGGNRRVAGGTADPEVPVLAVREADGQGLLAILLVVSVHPTVLHEDSTLVSGDFPGHTRTALQQDFGGIPIVYFTGAAGNQSPRHFTRNNTVSEASRLGNLLADSVKAALQEMVFEKSPRLGLEGIQVEEFLFNDFPEVEAAKQREERLRLRFESMREAGEDPRVIRTAETDWFGAIRMRLLAERKASGELEATSRENCLPAEIQVLRVGAQLFVSWPGEVFVEFALALREKRPDCRVITYANGHTQGYLVTAEAVEEGGYEASAATFKSPESAQALVSATIELLNSLD